MIRTIANFVAILGAWLMLASALTLVPGITNSVIIPFPQNSLMEALPDDVLIIRWSEQSAVLYSERSGFVTELYKAGAPIVLPARKSGCIDLRKKTA